MAKQSRQRTSRATRNRRYTLGGTDAGHFDIDSATGQLMTSGALDYESTSSYTVTVTATDDDPTNPLSSETTVAIEVMNVEEDGT